MQITEFMQETMKLEKFYAKEMEQYEKDIWYQELKNMPVNRYSQIIKKAFSQCKFMPRLADIVAINKEMISSINNQNQTSKVGCNKCNGDGVIKYYKDIEGKTYEYFARCICQNANEFKYDGTKISDAKHRSKFYIPLIAEIGF